MVTPGAVRRLVFILGDQLSRGISSLRDADPRRDLVLLCEVDEEATHVAHHKQKIVFILAAMRHFAQELRDDGWRVEYLELEDGTNPGSFRTAVAAAAKRHRPERIVVTEAGEWRVQQMLLALGVDCGIPVDIRADDRFLCSHDAFRTWAQGRAQVRLEWFYRDMRRRTGLLMEGDAPAGGRWNFDRDNRAAMRAGVAVPPRRHFRPDGVTRDVIALVKRRYAKHFGEAEPFGYAVTRGEALAALDDFVTQALARFGDYQDAMVAGEATLYHSGLSAYLNVGLLDPREVCERVAEAYAAGDVPINSAEGFIRQVIGWREYVRGIYWLEMPAYAEQNYFGATRTLPDFYWSGETAMRCMREVITQTRDRAYAHHIQRLMVTGNFALIAGMEPRRVHEWYLAVYVDAFEWVELPNTLGMSQFADGGRLGSKPYAASGAYIDRMSDYCRGCAYDVKRKYDTGACPFNSLYWDFLVRNRTRLAANRRLRSAYATWDRLAADRKRAYRETATAYLERIEEL